MKKYTTRIVRLSIWTTFILAFFIPDSVHAETHITDGFLFDSATWDIRGSPYIIDADMSVPAGRTLTIGPGVVVKADPALGYAPSFFVGGELNVKGAKGKPVILSGFYNLNIYYATATISRLDISATKGVVLNHSKATISSSTIYGSTNGIYVKASNASIVGSRITGNGYGIYVDPVMPVYLYGYSDPAHQVNVGAIIPSNVTVTSSSLVDNKLAAIDSAETTSVVQATNNWWGDAGGPTATRVATSSRIMGQVNYIPWSDHDPTIEDTSTPCCSSVLFLPGLEGTWLYRYEPSLFGSIPLIGGVSTNTLWAPNRNDDVRKLFLDSNGSSTDTSIYSGEPIDNVFNIFSVYGSFMRFMDSLVSTGKIGEWRSFGYDWRKPISDVVYSIEKKATMTESLVSVVEDLASRSRTGKVTIIAHSNGGLVAKYLVKVLSDSGKVDLVDGVISVAVPYLGTPEAISALLYGDHQSIAYGLILNSEVAKQLGQNMSSAYSLLPSREYFSHTLDPLITFADGKSVNSHEGLSDFISGASNGFLASAGDAIQSVLTNFSWPANVYRYSLVGWNVDTPKSLVYINKEKCFRFLWLNFSCSTVLTRYEKTTIMGDGTVVVPSAAYSGLTADGASPTKVVSIDLASSSAAENKSFDHVNILESSTTQAVIGAILTADHSINGGSLPGGGSTIGGSVLPGGTSLGEPNYNTEPVHLVVSVDAAASLDVHDSSGNHTGLIMPPAGVTDYVVAAYEEKVPGSHFSVSTDDSNGSGSDSNADGITNTSISLPNNNQQYSVTVNGGGFGSFTLNLDKVQGTTTLGHIEFADIPMTPSSTATTIIEVAPNEPIASSTSPMSVDIDGDGTIDFVASSTVNSTAQDLISSTTDLATISTTSPISNNGATNPNSAELFKKYLKRFCN